MGRNSRVKSNEYIIMKIPILTYHATNISGNEYHTNDHIALEQDLKLFIELDIHIISAKELVEWVNGFIGLDNSKKYVVLTFDDGSELDYTDWDHPTCGFQKSFFTLLRNHKEMNKCEVHATSFVIASPYARKILEQTCLGGYPMWGDSWWQLAEDSGLISIENHSWDHLHPTLDKVMQKNNLKGDFSVIEIHADADQQITQSSEYIDSRIIDKNICLFAYPYGDFNSYLTEEFFPKSQNTIIGCFTCKPKHVEKNTNIWKVPRYVCGLDWRSNRSLANIIMG